MSALEALGIVVDHLERAGIPFMLTGSLASSVHGEPRSTQDVDIVIDPEHAALGLFLRELDRARFYVSDDAAWRALEHRDMFNIIDLATNWKTDLMVRKDRPFSRAEFDRRRWTDVLGVRLALATAEDIVLAKLEWGRHSGSERQKRDVVGILTVQPDLDWAYMRAWAVELGVVDLLQQAEEEAGN
jgi:hypothetical protein